MSITNILNAEELASLIGGMIVNGPNGEMFITVINKTQFELTYEDASFNSGRFVQAPQPIPMFSSQTFSVTDTDGVPLGVEGMVLFQVDLGGMIVRIGVGFGNPIFGSYTINVAFDPDYNQLANSQPILSIADFMSGTIDCLNSAVVKSSSCVFKGTDSDGEPAAGNFSGTATPATSATVIIEQAAVS